MYFSEPREVTLNRKYSISIWGKKTSQIQVHTPSIKSKSEVTMTPSTDGNILTAERTPRMEGPLIKLSGSCSKQGYLYLWVWPVLDSSFPITVTVWLQAALQLYLCAVLYRETLPPQKRERPLSLIKSWFCFKIKSLGGQPSCLSKPLSPSHITLKRFPLRSSKVGQVKIAGTIHLVKSIYEAISTCA